jgi:hypothetical protein
LVSEKAKECFYESFSEKTMALAFGHLRASGSDHPTADPV